jgi:Zn-dependent peptidase ImmA (M78 family)
MHFFHEKISRLHCHWNKRPLTEDVFHRLCRKHRIAVQEMPLRVGGFYYCVLGRHYIAIDSRLPPHKKLFVMFHEFAHYLMHAPDTNTTANFHGVGRKTRKETEADAFALCALIPKPWIETRTAQELIEDEGLPVEIVRQRQAVYELHGC